MRSAVHYIARRFRSRERESLQPGEAPGRPGLRRILVDEQGGMLLEALVSVALLVTVLTMALQGLAAGSRAVEGVRDLTTAQNLARSQLEYTLASTYCAPPCSYPALAAPAGYAVSAEAQAYPGADTNLEYVVVTVSKDGAILAEINGIKANR